MIFAAMAVGITGIVLIVSGQQLDELRTETLNRQARCKDIKTGQATTVLRDEWLNLRDQKQTSSLVTYLFQNKGNRNNYKIIAMLKDHDPLQAINSLVISSELLDDPIKVESNNSICSGVLEQSISIDYGKHQKAKERISFDLTILIHQKWSSGEASPIREKTVQFTLENAPQTDAEPELSSHVRPQGYVVGVTCLC